MILKCENLSYIHKGSGNGIHDFDAEFSGGGIFGILGPNGAGKSTLIRMLAGCVKPQKGRVLAGSADMFLIPPKRRASLVSFLPQTFSCDFSYTCLEAVSFGRYASEGFMSEAGSRCREVLDELGIGHLADRRISDMSGGEFQKAMIAQTAVQGAECIILDEPVSHLDAKSQYDIMSYLKKQAVSGKSVILTIHDLSSAALWCDRVIFIRNGLKIADGSVKDVFTEENIKRVFSIDAQVIDYSGCRIPVARKI